MDSNDINQQAEELKMKMSPCKPLGADDMKKILDLIIGINSKNQPGQSSQNQDNKTVVVDLGDVFYNDFINENGNAKAEAVAEAFSNLVPSVEVKQDENLYIKVNTIANTGS